MKWCNDIEFQLVNLEWERIFLHFEIETKYQGIPKFILTKFKREKDESTGIVEVDIKKSIELRPENHIGDKYSFCLNMAAADGRSFLENGQWRLATIIPEGFCAVEISNSLAYDLDSKTRIFKYGGRKFAYNMSFSLASFDDDHLEMYFNSYFMKVNHKWQKRNYVAEASSVKWKCRNAITFTIVKMIGLLYHILAAVFPKNGKRILFMSETRGALWGNLKYIEERIKERGLDQEFELYYSFRKVLESRGGIISWLRVLILIAKCDYIFIDDYAPIFGYFKLSEKTKLIQVWHAGEGFKSVGYSRFGKAGSPYPGESCHKMYDYVTVGSKNLIHVYEEVFGIEKEAFLPTGMARLDDFLDKNKITQFKREFYGNYPQFEGKRIILFAPTFRGTGQKTAYYDYDKLDLKQIYEFCGEEYVFLAKVHPFVREKIQIPAEYADRIYDFAEYPNINDLYYVTELLITDYSSNYYEYALMKKPVLFFTYDREKYELIRGVHRSVKKYAPGKVCDTFEEMMESLYHKDFEVEKIEKFVEDNFSEYDGCACDRIIDQIILKK